MPDGLGDSGGQVAQRGFRRPQGRFPGGRFPGRFPGGRFPRPIIIPPIFFPINRCFYIDRMGRCCDRFGRCFYRGWPFAGTEAQEGWYGASEGWDMMADIDDMDDDMDSTTAFNDFVDYDD